MRNLFSDDNRMDRAGRVPSALARGAFAALLCLVAGAASARGACEVLAGEVDGPDNNFRPPLEATVTGRGKLPLYSAPAARCVLKGRFAAPGKSATVYKHHRQWSNVMLIVVDEDGEAADIVAWVPSKRLKIIGQYGHNPVRGKKKKETS
jgi:hypothetical protein